MKTSEKVTLCAISPRQARAARALLNWTIEELADKSGIAKRTVIRFENSELDGASKVRPTTIERIQSALESAGITFIASNGGGLGLRRSKP